MADGHGARPPTAQQVKPNAQTQIADWITIWQSELAAMATDRELQETWVRMVDMWAQTAERAARLLPLSASKDEPAHGPAGPVASPGATPTVAPPDARDATINRLAERVAELERRLAALSPPARGPEGGPNPNA